MLSKRYCVTIKNKNKIEIAPYRIISGKVDKDLHNKTSLREFKKAVRAINLTDVLDGRCSCYACST